MKNRRELAKHFAKLGFKKGAEVGVFWGYYSRILLDTIPELELLCIDTWDMGETGDEALRIAKETLLKYSGVKLMMTKSVEAAKDVPDNSLDFVFIDAAHDYENVRKDIEAWYPKVKSGGIVSGHDYFKGHSIQNVQVIQAVDDFVTKHNLKLELTDWDKRNPYKDDRQPCWYFTK